MGTSENRKKKKNSRRFVFCCHKAKNLVFKALIRKNIPGMEVTGHCVILGRLPNRGSSRNWTPTVQSSWDLAEGGDVILGCSGEDGLFLVLNLKRH